VIYNPGVRIGECYILGLMSRVSHTSILVLFITYVRIGQAGDPYTFWC